MTLCVITCNCNDNVNTNSWIVRNVETVTTYKKNVNFDEIYTPYEEKKMQEKSTLDGRRERVIIDKRHAHRRRPSTSRRLRRGLWSRRFRISIAWACGR